MKAEEIEKIKKAGKIAQEVVAYAKEIVKPGVELFEVASKIDEKIEELGGKPAFPVNLSVNEIAAHSTPKPGDTDVARGLLKVDIGVHVDGYVADTAFSVNLDSGDESEVNKKLIGAAEEALEHALHTLEEGVRLRDVGLAVQRAISSKDLLPIVNLSGHEIKRYDLHAGLTIPNYDNGSDIELEEGLYAVEPFATNGVGKIRDGKPSGIYIVQNEGNVRDSFAREVLNFIDEEYKGLPFCSRWINRKFGGRGLLALRQIEQAGILHQYAQLVEAGGGKVAQAEHSVFLFKGEKFVTTKD